MRWARTVLSNVTANELKYHILIERLEYSLQQSARHQTASLETASNSGSSLGSSRWKNTNFAGQARYAREPTSRASIVPKEYHRTRAYPKATWTQRAAGHSTLTCHNCGRHGCRWYKCKEPLAMKRVAQNRLKAANNRPGSVSRVNVTDVADALAQDICDAMETLLVSDEINGDDFDEESKNEALMTSLEQGATEEASINHSAHFDLPNDSCDEANVDGDLDALEDFYSGA